MPKSTKIKASIPLHSHDYYEYEFVLAGSGKHFINGIWQETGPGDFWLLKENDYHALQPSPSLTICFVACCLFRVPEHLHVFLEKQEYPMTGKLSAANTFSQACRHFDELLCIKKDDPLCIEKKAAFTQLLFCHFLENANHVSLTEKHEASQIYMHTVIRHLQDHYAEKIGLSDAAQLVGLTSCYLSTLFSQYASCSFTEYLTKLRIIKSIKMISDTDLSLLEIANRSGFGCISSMNRAFRKYVNAPPSRFRNLDALNESAEILSAKE